MWDAEMIAEGHEIVRACLRRNRPGPYQFQAAIAAVHTDSPTAGETDWDQIVALYDQLTVVAPTPVVQLNRAIAIAESGDMSHALRLLEGLELDDYYLYHATVADLLQRLDRADEAAHFYARALELTANDAERSHLERRLQAARASSSDDHAPS
jgi:RNA polymerase sigma-70 factor (ECF subfamily)